MTSDTCLALSSQPDLKAKKPRKLALLQALSASSACVCRCVCMCVWVRQGVSLSNWLPGLAIFQPYSNAQASHFLWYPQDPFLRLPSPFPRQSFPQLSGGKGHVLNWWLIAPSAHTPYLLRPGRSWMPSPGARFVPRADVPWARGLSEGRASPFRGALSPPLAWLPHTPSHGWLFTSSVVLRNRLRINGSHRTGHGAMYWPHVDISIGSTSAPGNSE